MGLRTRALPLRGAVPHELHSFPRASAQRVRGTLTPTLEMGKCQQTMNRKRKMANKQKKENKRALRLRLGLVDKNKRELAAVSGPRTGKQARKQLKAARRQHKARLEKA